MAANYIVSHAYEVPKAEDTNVCAEVWDLAYTFDSKLVSGHSDGSLYIWPEDKNKNTETEDLEGKLIDKSPLGIVGLEVLQSSDQDGYVITSSLNSQLSRYDLNSLSKVSSCSLKPGTSHSISLFPDKKANLLATTGSQGTIQLVSTGVDDFGSIRSTLSGRANTWGTFVSFSPDEKLLVNASEDGHLSIWDVKEQTLHHSFPAHARSIRVAKFSPDSSLLVSGGDDKIINIYDLRTNNDDSNQKQNKTQVNRTQHVAALAHHTGWVESLDFKPDGRILASGASDGYIRLYDLRNFSAPLITMREHEGDVWSLAWQPEKYKSTVSAQEGIGALNQLGAGRFTSAGQDGGIRVWRGTGG